MKKWLGRTSLILPGLAAALAAGGYAYLQHPKFGALPAGARLQAVKHSPHYVNGEFQNLIDTPMRTEDTSFVPNVISMLFDRNPNLKPSAALPSVHVDLKGLSKDGDVVVWLGHSSYFVQLNGKRILIDPVFSTNAGPFPGTNIAFPGTTPYTADDMPDIDVLLVTHDHWDHLDYPSAMALLPRVGQVVVGLGVGEFFDRWGYPSDRIHEADWNDVLELVPGVRIHVLPARHYSGRMLTRNQTLWVAFALQTSQRRLFFSGDSGYGPHFREIGERFGGFDLAALDMGQYDKRWANIHMFPEQAAQAAEDLRAKALLPAHVGRFSIAAHDWDEPLNQIDRASRGRPYRLLTPSPGALVLLDNETQRFPNWWKRAI
ncbi:MBL fold metallo-hydrolase [Cupriavidus alkaliphilus]|uniref:MBL fold metallo-hydrolase n=1 Tax=Cupriavidus alkaliphilus TaxID=942866 RepID=UPI0016202DF7|nr:MBL fold metallo-hydrolase [Cupriavidus alkaliphilus]MBB3014124.1 L-ascorbate metabolism protein UlaG (beta-lactamase superfamily) [Cupriavidus alkaliphilus]